MTHPRHAGQIRTKQWFDCSPAVVISPGQQHRARHGNVTMKQQGVSMLTGTIRTSLAILAACVAASTQAQAHSSSCTPAHLMSAFKQVEAECGSAKIISAHRPGARIRGTGHVSQHSFCNGTNGAIDVVFSNRACALSALRKTNYTIITYGKSSHIHIGTDGWRNGANTNVARHNTTARTRVAARQRAGTRMRRGRARSVQVAQQQWSNDQNGWSDASWSNSGGAEAAYPQRPGARSASGRRAGVRVAQRQRSNDQNGWGGGNWSPTGEPSTVIAAKRKPPGFAGRLMRVGGCACRMSFDHERSRLVIHRTTASNPTSPNPVRAGASSPPPCPAATPRRDSASNTTPSVARA